jgi:hypothetical protein
MRRIAVTEIRAKSVHKLISYVIPANTNKLPSFG